MIEHFNRTLKLYPLNFIKKTKNFYFIAGVNQDFWIGAKRTSATTDFVWEISGKILPGYLDSSQRPPIWKSGEPNGDGDGITSCVRVYPSTKEIMDRQCSMLFLSLCEKP